MQANEFNKLSHDELNAKLASFREELFNLRFQHATAQLENTARIPQVKKNIARILTVLSEKQKGA
ncbi:50S ribosomal protein L29 [Oceanidesulfovibrio marinus]|uniref:Large ribosomal subunit protein uL29 n=1 Tax=Oceanidesulfovibrio marinus TaxID=370038 RepID=A0A6P1ZGC1_9BACT|nr:50S ribosomal protein L29 [Oceanidesulfovibrio marinus]QJT07657.1 50S ribosomal protein L29 [Oceanidesulfovibrio marinus]TVM32014.1 50S ribosomal protein L29 [Oceanidesulfovibrio marinus]